MLAVVDFPWVNLTTVKKRKKKPDTKSTDQYMFNNEHDQI